MAVAFNPFDPDQVDRQDEILAELRPGCPVHSVMPGVFLLTRHRDIAAASRDAETFNQAPFRPLVADTRTPDELQLGESNPPHHAKIRKLLQSVLSPPRVRAMEPLVQSVCDSLVDGFADRGGADLIADLARPLPANVIGQLTGVPESDRPFLHEYSDLVVATVQEQDEAQRLEAVAKVAEFDAHLLDVIRQRRESTSRPDDAMTALVDHRDGDGKPLSDEKVLLHLSKDLITGGIDTTTHLVGNLFYDLLTTPGAYERVREDRSLIPVAVEESLRHLPVVSSLFRHTARDVTVSGTEIPAGSVVVLAYASANHDEEVFDHPDVFDLDRGEDVRRHLGFGWGVHLCVGAGLARLEGAHVLRAVLDRIPAMQLADDYTYRRVRMFIIRGPTRLDVTFGPATPRGPSGLGGASTR